MHKLLIIGAGMATAELLKQLVSFGYEGSIEVIGEEAVSCYNRILLSSILSAEKTEDDLLLIEQDWYKKHAIKISSNEKVNAVNLESKVAFTSLGRSTDFDQFILKTFRDSETKRIWQSLWSWQGKIPEHLLWLLAADYWAWKRLQV